MDAVPAVGESLWVSRLRGAVARLRSTPCRWLPGLWRAACGLLFAARVTAEAPVDPSTLADKVMEILEEMK